MKGNFNKSRSAWTRENAREQSPLSRFVELGLYGLDSDQSPQFSARFSSQDVLFGKAGKGRLSCLCHQEIRVLGRD